MWFQAGMWSCMQHHIVNKFTNSIWYFNICLEKVITPPFGKKLVLQQPREISLLLISDEQNFKFSRGEIFSLIMPLSSVNLVYSTMLPNPEQENRMFFLFGCNNTITQCADPGMQLIRFTCEALCIKVNAVKSTSPLSFLHLSLFFRLGMLILFSLSDSVLQSAALSFYAPLPLTNDMYSNNMTSNACTQSPDQWRLPYLQCKSCPSLAFQNAIPRTCHR